MLTPEEFAKQVEGMLNKSAPTAHIESDELMENTLRELGYGAGIELILELERWYE